jgi:hypothetical protein
MRIRVLKASAAAMLFGGTLGASGAASVGVVAFGGATCSQFTASGVSITTSFTAAAFAGSATPSIIFRQAFTVAADVVMNRSALLPSSGWYLRIDVVGGARSPPTTDWDGTNSTLTLAASAAGKHYLLSYGSFDAAVQSGTALSVSFAAFPAPGALALLGVAGMVGGRRRR